MKYSFEKENDEVNYKEINPLEKSFDITKNIEPGKYKLIVENCKNPYFVDLA